MVKNDIKDFVNYCCVGYDFAKTIFTTLSEDERIELKAILKQKCVHSKKWLDNGISTITFAMVFVSLVVSLHIPYSFGWINCVVMLFVFGFILIEHMKCKYIEGIYVKTLKYLKEFEKSLTKS